MRKKLNDKIKSYVAQMKQAQEQQQHEILDIAGVLVRLDHHEKTCQLEDRYQEEVALQEQNVVTV